MNDLLDTVPCGFLSFGDDGTIRAVNTTLLRMLGRERAAVEGRHVQEIFSPGAKIFYQTHVFPLLKMRGEVEEIYLSLRAKNGEEIPALINAKRSERDGVAVNDCILMRMRQRSQFEDELLKAKNAAQKANKAKDEFLAALSHELRTPLNPVLMLSTAMELDFTLPAEAREQAGIIRRNAELETRLIDDLLDMTRITHGKLKLVTSVVDLHTLLSGTEEITKSEGRAKRITVKFLKEAGEHHVLGDSARLQQVLWNLAKNAIKFTSTGGEVRMVTSNETPGRLAVKVIDTGIGIDPAVLPKIFDAFEQGQVSTQQFGGLGLGLAITRAIVGMHGGTIRAESEGKGQGATFTVEFAFCPAPAAAGESRAPLTASTGPLRLLLVEDHDSTREVLARILRRAGHEVHAAGTGEAALEIAATVGRLDAVISDIGLPDQSGFDLMRELTARHNLPGIALSGYGMEEDLKNARAAGFRAHLVKPVSFDQLRVLLDQVANGKLI